MTQRINSIDSLRYIAIFFVILIHCFPASGTLKFVVDELARFAVPYFFIVSGFFLGLKLVKTDKNNIYLKFAYHIAKLYLFWTAIYFLNPDMKQIHQIGLIASYIYKAKEFFGTGIVNIFSIGISYHFWFFNSLIFTVLFFMIFKLKYLKWFISISLILYALGVLGGAYSHTTIGLHFGFNTRQFIFFSSLPFAVGIYIASCGLRISDRWALAIFLSGLAFHFIEGIALGLQMNDYVFSTVLMGIGLFFIALNNRTWLNSARLASLGQLAFGIYAIHVLIAHRLNMIIEHYEKLRPFWFIIYPILVLLISTLVIGVLKKYKISQKLGISKFV